MTKAALIAALANSPNVQDTDEVKFFAADGTEKTVVTIDRVDGVDGMYPTSEPNQTPFIKVQLGA